MKDVDMKSKYEDAEKDKKKNVTDGWRGVEK